MKGSTILIVIFGCLSMAPDIEQINHKRIIIIIIIIIIIFIMLSSEYIFLPLQSFRFTI